MREETVGRRLTEYRCISSRGNCKGLLCDCAVNFQKCTAGSSSDGPKVTYYVMEVPSYNSEGDTDSSEGWEAEEKNICRQVGREVTRKGLVWRMEGRDRRVEGFQGGRGEERGSAWLLEKEGFTSSGCTAETHTLLKRLGVQERKQIEWSDWWGEERIIGGRGRGRLFPKQMLLPLSVQGNR